MNPQTKIVPPRIPRRTFLQRTFATGAAFWAFQARADRAPGDSDLRRATSQPVLDVSSLKDPIVIEKIELLRNGASYLVRVTSNQGAQGLAVANEDRMRYLHPIFLDRVAPFFIGKDARQLDDLVDGVFLFQSNYKLQGLAFWVCVASVEFAVLDLLGKLASIPIGDLLGGVIRRDIAVYQANNYRTLSAKESVQRIARTVGETGAKAVKCKIGGRMSNNADSIPGRTKALIPLLRETLGNEMTLYADSNGSYDPPKAIEVGRLLEEFNYGFFEEPCPFDRLDETKEVADALSIPIAGGEQESSHHRFQWMIRNRAVQIVQPDLFYYGGMIRSIRVARMAEVAGLDCTPHISGAGLGYLCMAHFCSCTPNVGPFQEYKGTEDIPVYSETSPLRSVEGILRAPSGPGFGIDIDPDFIAQARLVEMS